MIGISSVSSKGQITIPTEIRQKFGINAKEKVIITAENGIIVVKKIEDVKFET